MLDVLRNHFRPDAHDPICNAARVQSGAAQLQPHLGSRVTDFPASTQSQPVSIALADTQLDSVTYSRATTACTDGFPVAGPVQKASRSIVSCPSAAAAADPTVGGSRLVRDLLPREVCPRMVIVRSLAVPYVWWLSASTVPAAYSFDGNRPGAVGEDALVSRRCALRHVTALASPCCWRTSRRSINADRRKRRLSSLNLKDPAGHARCLGHRFGVRTRPCPRWRPPHGTGGAYRAKGSRHFPSICRRQQTNANSKKNKYAEPSKRAAHHRLKLLTASAHCHDPQLHVRGNWPRCGSIPRIGSTTYWIQRDSFHHPAVDHRVFHSSVRD